MAAALGWVLTLSVAPAPGVRASSEPPAPKAASPIIASATGVAFRILGVSGTVWACAHPDGRGAVRVTRAKVGSYLAAETWIRCSGRALLKLQPVIPQRTAIVPASDAPPAEPVALRVRPDLWTRPLAFGTSRSIPRSLRIGGEYASLSLRFRQFCYDHRDFPKKDQTVPTEGPPPVDPP